MLMNDGAVRPVFGSIPGLAELQARWVAKVVAGKVALPNQKKVWLITIGLMIELIGFVDETNC